ATITPNPASADVTARFVMPTEGIVSIRVYDLAGALITESRLQNVSSGVHAMPVALNSVSVGGYVMVIDAGMYRSALPFSVTR
ncbi:MAG: T9SS type A sorting domain-containing protein, partial [Ignavibacteria bacterium]